MSVLLGTQLDEDYIQIGSVKLPLPKNPTAEGEEWESLRTTPLEPFQASVVLGDDSLISDDRIAIGVFSDFHPGVGVRRYTEVESVAGIEDGDLLTVEGVATLQPYRNVLAGAASLPAGVYGNVPATGFLFNWTQRYRYAAYSPTGVTRIWDSTLSTFGAPTGPPDGTPPYSAFARFAGYWVYCVLSGGVGTIWYSTDGKAYTAGWAPGGTTQFLGLMRHDGKLYAFTRDTATNEMNARWISTQAQLTAGAGVAWPGVSALGFALEVAEVVTNIVEWTDKITGDKMLYVLTSRRLIGYNDGDFWVEYWLVPNANDSWRPFALAFPRDNLLYIALDGTDSVFVFNHQTIEEIGPNKGFGLPKFGNGALALKLLAANTRNMFAFGTSNHARILIANDAFGWSPFYRPTLANPADLTSAIASAATRVAGMFLAETRVVVILGNGAVEYLEWPDTSASIYKYDPTGASINRAHHVGPNWIVSGEFDGGQELLWKLAKWFRLHLERMNGTYALPPNCQAFFKWQFDGGAWSSVTTLTSANTFPKTLPLPSLASQTGIAFRKLRWAFGLQGEAVSFNYETPILRAVQIGFTREPDIYDGLQVTIDLTDDRFDDGNGRPLMNFYGRDRAYLRNYIETLKSGPGVAKTHYPVTIGWRGFTKTYASMDVRVAGVEDPQDRYGRWVLTLRQLDAPPDG